MRILSQLLTASLVLAVLALGVVLGLRSAYLGSGPLAEAQIFTVPAGAVLRPTSDRLEEEGVIESSTMFRNAARFFDRETALKAGSFYVPAGASTRDVLLLVTGGVQVAIREGATATEAFDVINAVDDLAGPLLDISAMDLDALEGMIAPGLWRFPEGTTRQTVLEALMTQQQKQLDELWAMRDTSLPLASQRDAVILASIIERETSLRPEYPVVASVFYNRIDRGEPLGVDAAVIYGIMRQEGSFNGDLTDANLDDLNNPWNLRRIRGLPPSAIANPGRLALEAVLNPAETSCLFFVADGTDGHIFAYDYGEHRRYSTRWSDFNRVLQRGGAWSADVTPVRRLAPSDECAAEHMAAYGAMDQTILIEEGMSIGDVAAAVQAASFLDGTVEVPTSGSVTPGLYRVRVNAPAPDRQLVLDYLLSGRS